ncbi:MAG: lysylphosphatidylglycerol synthase transmembrane domain-containing protein [bacterium]
MAGVVLLGLLLLAVRRIDAVRVATELRALRLPWLLAALGCYVAIIPLWALEWCILAPRLGGNTFPRMLAVVAMTSSTLNTTAFFLGEAAGIVLLVTRIGVSRSAALSVMAMDQLLVGVAKLAVLAAAASSISLPPWMGVGVRSLVLGVAILFAASLWAAWQHESLERRAARFLPARLSAMVGRMGHALAPLRSVPRSGGALLLALAKKLVEVLAILCVQRAFGIAMPFASGILVLAALNLATLLPVVPGNLGVYEGAVVLTYTHLGLTAEQALGIAVVQHACYFVALALPGYAWLARAGASRAVTAAR